MKLTGNNSWKENLNSAPSFQLSHDEIHIWSASLEQSAQDVTGLFSSLSQDEKERSKRFYFARDQNRYITGRGMLRALLGNYLGIKPDQIEFSYGAYGKPALGTTFHGKNLQFNLSHSNDKVIYIFNWDQPIGIDIEHARPMKDMDDFALQCFTPNECNFIHALSKDKKQESFFKLWTCKEAFLKANGSGLTVPINQVEVSLATDGSASVTSIGDDREQAGSWHLELFTPIKDYQAALAIEEYEKQILFQQFDLL